MCLTFWLIMKVLMLMFGFIKKIFIGLLRTWFINSNCAANSEGSMERVFLNNRPCQATAILVKINSIEPLCYPFTVSVYKCVGSCNSIDNPCARLCVPNEKENMIAKVF